MIPGMGVVVGLVAVGLVTRGLVTVGCESDVPDGGFGVAGFVGMLWEGLSW